VAGLAGVPLAGAAPGTALAAQAGARAARAPRADIAAGVPEVAAPRVLAGLAAARPAVAGPAEVHGQDARRAVQEAVGLVAGRRRDGRNETRPPGRALAHQADLGALAQRVAGPPAARTVRPGQAPEHQAAGLAALPLVRAGLPGRPGLAALPAAVAARTGPGATREPGRTGRTAGPGLTKMGRTADRLATTAQTAQTGRTATTRELARSGKARALARLGAARVPGRPGAARAAVRSAIAGRKAAARQHAPRLSSGPAAGRAVLARAGAVAGQAAQRAGVTMVALPPDARTGRLGAARLLLAARSGPARRGKTHEKALARTISGGPAPSQTAMATRDATAVRAAGGAGATRDATAVRAAGGAGATLAEMTVVRPLAAGEMVTAGLRGQVRLAAGARTPDGRTARPAAEPSAAIRLAKADPGRAAPTMAAAPVASTGGREVARPTRVSSGTIAGRAEMVLTGGLEDQDGRKTATGALAPGAPAPPLAATRARLRGWRSLTR
jgi:hypothetical protein